jgi:hypothetical protein
MDSTFLEQVKFFTKKFSLKIIENELLEGQRHEIEDGICSALKENGLVRFAETGAPPPEYLPSVINDYLDMIEGKTWSINNVTTLNTWQTANVILKHKGGEDYSFTINNIDGADWVPYDLSVKMNEFSKTKCDKTLITFFSDDPYLILALPHEAAEELEGIIEQYSVPYELF